MVAVFSRAEESLPDNLPPDTLEQEFRNSMALLDITDDIHMGCIPVRHFPEHRQSVLEDLVRINRDYGPDLVLTMNSSDTHQDHTVVHQETVRAFRGSTVLGYEIPWNQQQNVINLFVEVNPEDVEMKAKMLGQYRSQVELRRPYVSDDYVWSAATFRGFQARMKLAEAYEVITMQWSNNW